MKENLSPQDILLGFWDKASDLLFEPLKKEQQEGKLGDNEALWVWDCGFLIQQIGNLQCFLQVNSHRGEFSLSLDPNKKRFVSSALILREEGH